MFRFIPDQRYMMPVQFGPQPGFHNPPPDAVIDRKAYPKRRTAFVHYLTRAEQLAEILPPNFELVGEPVISFEFSHHTEVPHLGGRGYGVFGVNYPARYLGRDETVQGMFRSVTWENCPDAVLMGREDLGCHKLFCDFGEPKVIGGNYTYQAGLYGRSFFEMELTDLVECPAGQPPVDLPFTGPPTIGGTPNQGLLFYKYIPRINSPGVADVEHAVLMSSDQRDLTIERQVTCKGSARFTRVRWQDVPTYHHVVNGLAALDLLEFRGASLTFSRGAMALVDMRAIAKP
jgi:hypothetical protein